MEYNSKREDLIIPEYGRHVQKLVQHITKIEDRELRQKLAEGVVSMMLTMSSSEKKNQDYSDKMWTHMLKISNWELDVDVPEGVEKTKPAPVEKEQRRVDYPTPVKKYRHYGKYIQDLIEKALEMEEGEKKQEFVRIIGSYMKTAYKQWNKDSYVNDDSVQEDIKIITKGKLTLSEDASFDYLKSSNNSYKSRGRKTNNRNSGSRNNKGKNKNYRRKSSY
jgi:hypothetical protein